jgi:hypothetical protein
MKLTLLAFLLVACLSSQDVKISHLDKHTTDKALQSWRNLKAAEADWASVKQQVAKAYNSGSDDYRFSADFTVIVPGSLTGGGGTVWGNGTMWPCNSITLPIPASVSTSIDTVYR